MDLNQTWITLTVQAQRAFNFFFGDKLTAIYWLVQSKNYSRIKLHTPTLSRDGDSSENFTLRGI